MDLTSPAPHQIHLSALLTSLQQRLLTQPRAARPAPARLGVPALDAILGPLAPGDLVLVAATGETARLSFAMEIAMEASLHTAVAVVCGRHHAEDLAPLALAAASGVPHGQLSPWQVPERRADILDGLERCALRDLVFLDLGADPVRDLRAILTGHQERSGQLALAVLPSFEPAEGGPGEAAETLRSAATHAGVAVIAAFDQGLEGRGTHPRMLVETGEITALIALSPAAGGEGRRELVTADVHWLRRGQRVNSTEELSWDPTCCTWET